MSNILKDLLEINSPLFNAGLASLEKSTGHSGVDTRLIADVLSSGHRVMRKLGLDTRDTTARELYNTLTATVQNSDIEELLFDTDYTLLQVDGRVISFNLIDVIENVHHQISFDRQITIHGRRALAGELVRRYIDHARTDESTSLGIFESMGLPLEDQA